MSMPTLEDFTNFFESLVLFAGGGYLVQSLGDLTETEMLVPSQAFLAVALLVVYLLNRLTKSQD